MVPLWLAVVGCALVFWTPVVGAIVLLVVFLAFLAQSLRVTSYTWNDVEKKRSFLGYPLFLLTRNFSMALG